MVRWQVFGAVALRRFPEVIPRRDPIQIKVQAIFDSFEASKSRFSQHEMKHIEDKRIKESEDITDVLVGETAQDREDRWVREKEMFKFAEYDDRLSKTQYLFMNTKFATDIKDQWILPQIEFSRELGDRNLADTARRALKDSLNIYNGFTIVSKIPSSVCSFKYPKKVQELTGFQGGKVFFIKAQLDMPDKSVLEAVDSSKNDKLRWLTRDEALPVVDHIYMRSLNSGLLSERRVNVERVLEKAMSYVKAVKKLSARVNQ